MLYRFKSKVCGDVVMAAEPAQALLRIMGKDDGPQGILLPADMPAALRALQAALATQADAPARSGEPKEPTEASGVDPVGLGQRAWPLMRMIEACRAAEEPMVWGV